MNLTDKIKADLQIITEFIRTCDGEPSGPVSAQAALQAVQDLTDLVTTLLAREPDNLLYGDPPHGTWSDNTNNGIVPAYDPRIEPVDPAELE
jgi:hypothetical protein